MLATAVAAETRGFLGQYESLSGAQGQQRVVQKGPAQTDSPDQARRHARQAPPVGQTTWVSVGRRRAF